jgi:hypothetical protein
MTLAHAATRAARCHCGAEYDGPQWSGLRVLERVDQERLRSLVTWWDTSRFVEVRCCGRCGSAIAKLVKHE